MRGRGGLALGAPAERSAPPRPNRSRPASAGVCGANRHRITAFSARNAVRFTPNSILDSPGRQSNSISRPARSLLRTGSSDQIGAAMISAPVRLHGNHENVNKSKGPDQGPGLCKSARSTASQSRRLFVLFGLLLRRREALEALQQFLLGHALDGDLGVVGIDAGARPSRSTARYRAPARRPRRISARNEPALRANLREKWSESAISRSETTGFLSLSRSIVSCEPDEIIRARCAAKRTRSNRLSTLSMQSSTVTRAIDCRSVKWDRNC